MLSMHPHAIAANGEDCLYMQDTWLVTADGGVPLADLPMEIVSGDALERSGFAGRAGSFGIVRQACRVVRDEDGVVRCAWGGGDHLEYRGLPRRRVGDAGHRRRAPVREAVARGLPGRPLVAHDPPQARGVPAGVRGIRLPAASRASDAHDVERLLGDAAIVRHRGKIESTINNARRAVELVEAEGSLAAFVVALRAARPTRDPRD